MSLLSRPLILCREPNTITDFDCGIPTAQGQIWRWQGLAVTTFGLNEIPANVFWKSMNGGGLKEGRKERRSELTRVSETVNADNFDQGNLKRKSLLSKRSFGYMDILLSMF